MKVRRSLLIGFGAAWVALIALGLGSLEHYSAKAGVVGSVPHQWPTQTKLMLLNDRSTLLVFLHPECACSKATVGELDTLLGHLDRAPHVKAIFIRPKGWSDDQLKSELWRQAAAIPNLQLAIDDGSEAKIFGAETSGHTVLFSSKGELQFAGGLTMARGHMGDNLGRELVTLNLSRTNAALVNLDIGKNEVPSTEVFGCGLFDRKHARNAETLDQSRAQAASEVAP